jgi:hypothetical protein
MSTGDQAQELMDRLAAVPERIARATAGRSDAVLQQATGADPWSVAAVFAHVRAADDIFAYRVYAMLTRDNPPLPAYDERRWAEVAGYAALPFLHSLAVFTGRRAELAAMLRPLAPPDWQRTGQHEQRGSLTVLDVVRVLVEHEEEHCAQIQALA